MVAAFFLGKQRDECRVESVAASAFEKFIRCAGGEHAAGIHGHEPVESPRLVHVGRGDDHAHAGAPASDVLDQIPELCAGQRIDPGRRLIENQEVGVVDQRAAQAELLLHPAGQLACRAREKSSQAGASGQIINAPAAFGGGMPEEPREKLQVLLDRQCGVEVLAQALRHVGDPGANFFPVPRARHVAAQCMHRALLQCPGSGQQRKQARLADAIRTDQSNHSARRDVERDAVQRHGLAAAKMDVGHAGDRDRARRLQSHSGNLISKFAGQRACGSSLIHAMPGRPVFTSLRCF